MRHEFCQSCNGTGKDTFISGQVCPVCNGKGYKIIWDPEDNTRRRTGGPTTRDVITFVVVVGTFIAIIWYIFTR